jgi:radical SAM superfamily enzyme YgiQ (UPF0313 family)
MGEERRPRIALIEAGSPGLNIYSHVAMGRGVPLLATVLRDAGYEVRAFVEDISGKDSIDWRFVAEADVVGMSAITCTLPRTVALAGRVREVDPRGVVVFGGPEPTCDPIRSLDHGADYVLRGEAERTLPRLIEALCGGPLSEPLEDIPGLVWREGGEVREGPAPVQLSKDELDTLPLIDRSLVHGPAHASVATAWRARGCGQKCDFCEVREIWPRYRTRSEDRTLDELMRTQDEGYAATFLIDDNAAADKPAFKRLLRGAAERGFVGTLVTQIRADAAVDEHGRLDEELLQLLKDAATVSIVCIGVESASDEDLEKIHKRMDSTRMAAAMRAMKRRGLLVHGMFIAFAGDTADVIKRNGAYARKYVSSLQLLAETPLPGTKSTAEHERRGSIMWDRLEDLAFFDGMHISIWPEKMAPVAMQESIAREYRCFYSWRRVVGAAVVGLLMRNRTVNRAQRTYLRGLGAGRRFGQWLRFQAEYRFAPAAFLATGRRRIRDLMNDQAYAEYLRRLQALDAQSARATDGSLAGRLGTDLSRRP